MYFTKKHEWIMVENSIASVGITAYAQNNLGDVVFVELPDIDREVEQSEAVAVVESAKSVSDVYAPLSGSIVEVNNSVVEDTSIINISPQKDGWLFKMTINQSSQLDEMMNEDEYNTYIQTL